MASAAVAYDFAVDSSGRPYVRPSSHAITVWRISSTLSSICDFSSLNVLPASALDLEGAGLSHPSRIWVTIPFLRACHLSRNSFHFSQSATASASSCSADKSSLEALLSAAGEKSFSLGTV